MVPLPEAKVTGRPVEMSLKRVHLLKAVRLGVEEIEIISEEEPVVCRAPGKLLIIQPVVPERERPAAAAQDNEPAVPEQVTTQQSSEEERQAVEDEGAETEDDPFGPLPESEPSPEQEVAAIQQEQRFQTVPESDPPFASGEAETAVSG
jgi:hypothetical protein